MSQAIKESIRDLEESVRKADEKVEREHYAAVVEGIRSGDASATAAKSLLRHVEALGKTAKDVPGLISVVTAHDGLAETSKAADDPALAAEVTEASKAWSDFKAETERIIRERAAEESQLWNTFRALQSRQSRGHEAKRNLQALEMRHRKLFGLPEPEQESHPTLPTPGVGVMVPFLVATMKPVDQQVRTTMGPSGYRVEPIGS